MKDGVKSPILSVMLRILRIGNQIQINMYAVGTEREIGMEEKAINVIRLTEKRGCLNNVNYNEHLKLLGKLQKAAISWVAFSHKVNEK